MGLLVWSTAQIIERGTQGWLASVSTVAVPVLFVAGGLVLLFVGAGFGVVLTGWANVHSGHVSEHVTANVAQLFSWGAKLPGPKPSSATDGEPSVETTTSESEPHTPNTPAEPDGAGRKSSQSE